MKPNHYLIYSTLVLLALAVAGCSDGEHAVAGPGKLTSIDQRPSLANPLASRPIAPPRKMDRQVWTGR